MNDINALVKSVSIENMMNQRDRVRELVEEAHRLLMEANTLAEAAHLGNLGDPFSPYRHKNPVNFMDVDGSSKVLHHIDGPAWAYLMEESGIFTFMDGKARAEWDKSITEGTYPPFTFDSVRETFRSLYANRGDMFERGIVEIYKGLSWDYKTNQPFKFGKRVILTGFSYGYIYGSGCNKIDDLQRVFCVLDGKQEPDVRDGVGREIRRRHIYEKADQYEGNYFNVRWFKKGTAHIAFKREDLVQQCNRILSRHYPGALAYQA